MTAELAAAALGVAALAHAFQLATAAVAARRVRRGRSQAASAPAPPPASITLVVPIAHLEPHLSETVASLFHLAGNASHELLFCLPQASEAEELVSAVAVRHPGVFWRVLVGRDGVSVNPKLDNLEKALAGLRTDWCCIIDANVLVPPDYLHRLFAAVRDDVAVLSVIPIGTSVHGYASQVEAAFLNTYQARLQLAADALGAGFAHGKTMLFRTTDLRRWGGPAALSIEVAEDAAITKLARQDGHKVRLLDAPVPQPLGRRTAAEVWRRQIRWAQLRRRAFPFLFAAEPLSTSVLPAIAAGGAAELSGFGFLAGCSLSLVLWVTVETALGILAGWRWGGRYALACITRDVLLHAMWLLAWRRQKYVWRGNNVDLRHHRPR